MELLAGTFSVARHGPMWFGSRGSAVTVCFQSVQGSSSKIDIQHGIYAREVPPLVCKHFGIDYLPTYGVFRWDPTVESGDDQSVEWILPDTKLTSGFLSDPFLILVVRQIFRPAFQSNLPAVYSGLIHLTGYFQQAASPPVDFSIRKDSECRAIPTRLCECLHIPKSPDHAAFRQLSRDVWQELPGNLSIAQMRLKDGDAVLVKSVPKTCSVTVHLDRIGQGRSVALSRTDRISSVAKLVGYRSEKYFAYLYDESTQTYTIQSKEMFVIHINVDKPVILLTTRVLVSSVEIKMSKSPHPELFLEQDLDYGMTLREAAEWFVYGDEPEKEVKFEVWKAEDPEAKLQVDRTLVELGIASGDELVVRISSQAEIQNLLGPSLVLKTVSEDEFREEPRRPRTDDGRERGSWRGRRGQGYGAQQCRRQRGRGYAPDLFT